jgi:hypothetical protein
MLPVLLPAIAPAEDNAGTTMCNDNESEELQKADRDDF